MDLPAQSMQTTLRIRCQETLRQGPSLDHADKTTKPLLFKHSPMAFPMPQLAYFIMFVVSDSGDLDGGIQRATCEVSCDCLW